METEMKKFIHEGELNQLALFAIPTTQTGVQRMYYDEIKPQSTDYEGPIDFIINRKEKTYIYPKASKIYIKCRCVKNDANVTPVNTDQYVLCNLLSSTLWKDIVVAIQGEQMSVSGPNHAYIS